MTSQPWIYLLLTATEMREAQASGTWSSPSLVTEGFIHASPYDQLERVANKHYRHKTDVHLVRVCVDRLISQLKWEPAAGSLYPHIYGPLNWDAVDEVKPVERTDDGGFVIRR